MNDNPVSFYDINGHFIEAHGGHILKHNNWYYWYGEDRHDNHYIHCYRSHDLKKWIDCGPIIDTLTKQEKIFDDYELGLLNENGTKVNLERPKVVYCEETQQFIMWMHYENGVDYDVAACAVAASKYPNKDFVYYGHFRPLGNMSRDCTLFQDNEKTYFISASNNNEDLHIYLLTSDCLRIDKLVNKLFIGLSKEAPALFKKDGWYYILTSYCTGWHPNQCQYSYAKAIEGPWSTFKNIGNYNTYHSQPAFVLKLNNNYYYFGDCWGGKYWDDIKDFDYNRSTYIIMEILINNENLFFDIPLDYDH